MNPFWSVSLFWIISVLFVAIALLLVLPPLLRKKTTSGKMERSEVNIAVYRDQLKEMEADRVNDLLADDQFHAAKVELEVRLAEDALGQQAQGQQAASGGRLLGYALGVLLPIAAFGLYFWLGSPAALMGTMPASDQIAGAPQGHDMAKLTSEMEAKVQANPGDGKARMMLGRIYAAQQRWQDAEQAYQQAIQMMPRDASVRSAFAESLAMRNNRNLSGEPMKLVQEALTLDPADPKGLELAGINAFQGKDYPQAIAYLTRLYRQLSPDDPYAKDIQAAIQEAQQASGKKLDNLSDQPPAPAAASGASISGKLDIAPALKARISPADTLYVFAGAGAGGPPVAALRLDARQLPAAFNLTDAMAMMPENKLSNFKTVTLTARISKSGQPMGASGDLEGSLANVKVGASDIHLTIDKIRP